MGDHLDSYYTRQNSLNIWDVFNRWDQGYGFSELEDSSYVNLIMSTYAFASRSQSEFIPSWIEKSDVMPISDLVWKKYSERKDFDHYDLTLPNHEIYRLTGDNLAIGQAVWNLAQSMSDEEMSRYNLVFRTYGTESEDGDVNTYCSELDITNSVLPSFAPKETPSPDPSPSETPTPNKSPTPSTEPSTSDVPVTSDEGTPKSSEPSSVTSEKETPESSEPTPVTSEKETPVTSEPTPVTSEKETPVTSEPTPVTSEKETPVTSEPTPVTNEKETPVTSEPSPVTSERETPVTSEPSLSPPASTSTTPVETAKKPSLENNTSNDTKSDKQKSNQSEQHNSVLAITGANVIIILGLAGLLILAGIVIMMLRRKKS